jgi:hypothetical protein
MSSFLVVLLHLPAGFDHARYFTGESQRPEADAAELKLSQKSTRPAAAQAAVAMPAAQLGCFGQFRRG